MKRKKKNIGFTVMAFDPSLTAFGFSVIKDNKVIDFGCIKTEKKAEKLRIRVGDDRVRRIQEINQIVMDSIIKHEVNFIVAEQPHGSQSSASATSLGMMLAIIQTIGDCLNIGVEWYSELDCKKAVVYKRECTKTEMVEAISKLYKVEWTGIKYKDEAIADSLAVYHMAKKNSFVIKTMINGRDK